MYAIRDSAQKISSFLAAQDGSLCQPPRKALLRPGREAVYNGTRAQLRHETAALLLQGEELRHDNDSGRDLAGALQRCSLTSNETRRLKPIGVKLQQSAVRTDDPCDQGPKGVWRNARLAAWTGNQDSKADVLEKGTQVHHRARRVRSPHEVDPMSQERVVTLCRRGGDQHRSCPSENDVCARVVAIWCDCHEKRKAPK